MIIFMSCISEEKLECKMQRMVECQSCDVELHRGQESEKKL